MIKFLIKWFINGVVVSLLLMWFTEMSFMAGVYYATLLTIVAYTVGDIIILQNTNNAVATLMDFVLAMAFLLFIAGVYNWSLTIGEAFVISIIVAFAEWFYHRFILRERLAAFKAS